MAQRKMYRTHRLRYVGIDVTQEAFMVHAHLEAMQGPGGFQPIGSNMRVGVPWAMLLRPDVTDRLDNLVRERLKRLWTVEQEDGLF